MQKIFIVVLVFRNPSSSVTFTHSNHFVSEISEALALDSALKSDESLELIKKGYSVAHTAVQAISESIHFTYN